MNFTSSALNGPDIIIKQWSTLTFYIPCTEGLAEIFVKTHATLKRPTSWTDGHCSYTHELGHIWLNHHGLMKETTSHVSQHLIGGWSIPERSVRDRVACIWVATSQPESHSVDQIPYSNAVPSVTARPIPMPQRSPHCETWIHSQQALLNEAASVLISHLPYPLPGSHSVFSQLCVLASTFWMKHSGIPRGWDGNSWISGGSSGNPKPDLIERSSSDIDSENPTTWTRSIRKNWTMYKYCHSEGYLALSHTHVAVVQLWIKNRDVNQYKRRVWYGTF